MSMFVVVTAYNPDWPFAFEREAAALRPVFGDLLAAIHHIGSTSVPGLQAKPVIDIMPVVTDIARVDDLNGALAQLGYEAMGEYGIPGRRYFRRGGDHRTHNMHVYQQENRAHIDRHLALRDYLRVHPAEVAEYGRLKAGLAVRYPRDIEAYMDGKDAFVKGLEQRALAWWGRRS